MTEVDRATGRLLDTAARLSDADVAAASLLPGWTRGHVLAHLARNADGLANLLHWARTGVETPQYPSWERRNADIEAGAGRSAAEHLDDLRAAAQRFTETADAMPAEAWAVILDTGYAQPAARVVWRRLREVEVHHVDLNAGYGTADWPGAFGQRLLHEVVAGMRDRHDAPPMLLRTPDHDHDLTIGAVDGAPTVSGAAHALAGWLTGRTRGEGVTIAPLGLLPQPPEWI